MHCWVALGLMLVFVTSFCKREALADETNPPGRFYLDADEARPILKASSNRLRAPVQRQPVQRQPARPYTANWSEVSQRQVIPQRENWRLRWLESEAGSTTSQHTATRQTIPVERPRILGASGSNVRSIQFNAAP